MGACQIQTSPILKQLKSIKIALCLVVVIMLLLSGVIVVGGVVVGIASFSSPKQSADYPYHTMDGGEHQEHMEEEEGSGY